MFVEERRNFILSQVNSKGHVHTSELAASLGVTTETIRKDIVALADSGLIQKEFGGASALVLDAGISPYDVRYSERQDEKDKIARCAKQFISEHSSVFLDAGSTNTYLVSALPSLPNIVVVTNSFAIIPQIFKVTSNVHFMGGDILENTMSTNGAWSEAAWEAICLDVAFLGTSPFSTHNGPCTTIFQDAQCKQRIVRRSKEKIVLADSSKFLSSSILQYVSWSEIDHLITTENAPEAQIRQLSQYTDVIIAP